MRVYLFCLFFACSTGICQAFVWEIGSTIICSIPIIKNAIPFCESMGDAVRDAYAIARRNIAKQEASEPPPISVPENRYTVDAFYAARRFQESSSRTKKLQKYQQLFEEVTKVLKRKYDISGDQLPSQEFLLTTEMANSVRECQKLFTIPNCSSKSKYATFDGSCNNLDHPSWGMVSSCFGRLVPPVYSDGIYQLRKTVSGEDLPNPRKLSVTLHDDKFITSDLLTVMFMQFGQFLVHDVSGSPLKTERFVPVDCCRAPTSNPECIPVYVEKDDPFYPAHGVTCLKALRTATCPTCRLGAREQTNQATSFIDLSLLYGNSREENDKLRSKDGTGTMKYIIYNGSELLPLSQHPLSDACSFQANSSETTCPETGDTRASSHRALTALHILFLRQHNRIARLFHKKATDWGDEKIFQETRRIVIAQMQMITYNEYVPLVLGPNQMKGLLVEKDASYTQYNPITDPTLTSEFSTAALRFGHSLINGPTPNTDEDSIADFYNWPFDFYENFLDILLFFMTVAPAWEFDRHVTEDVTNVLYAYHGQDHGLDLVMLDIFRGRDRGLPGYMQMLKFCEGPNIESFSQLDKVFRKEYLPYFEKAYKNLEDIDLFSGGLAEEPLDGATVGITFACIMKHQFKALKFGDRFFFEHEKQAGSFTPNQLKEIKETRFAKVVCENSGIEYLQEYIFLNPQTGTSNRSCESFPDINLDAWLE